jgi:hypothetical protein
LSLFLTNKKIHLNHKHSEETKDIQSQKGKKWFADGNEPWSKNNKHTSETIKKIFSKRPMNKLENFVSNILDENNIKYTHQFFLNKDGICKSYDFKIKDTNILLEVDGDYWHGGPSLDKHFYKLDEVKDNDEFKKNFIHQFTNKGRMKALLEKIPVSIKGIDNGSNIKEETQLHA